MIQGYGKYSEAVTVTDSQEELRHGFVRLPLKGIRLAASLAAREGRIGRQSFSDPTGGARLQWQGWCDPTPASQGESSPVIAMAGCQLELAPLLPFGSGCNFGKCFTRMIGRLTVGISPP